MSKLLSDEELDREIAYIISELAHQHMMTLQSTGRADFTPFNNPIKDLVNTQKRLYAAEEFSRLVEDRPLTTMYVPLNLYVERIETRINELRAEQRERIK